MLSDGARGTWYFGDRLLWQLTGERRVPAPLIHHPRVRDRLIREEDFHELRDRWGLEELETSDRDYDEWYVQHGGFYEVPVLLSDGRHEAAGADVLAQARAEARNS